MKKKIKKNKNFDTNLIEIVGDDSLIYPNCASQLKQPVPFLPDMNTTDYD